MFHIEYLLAKKKRISILYIFAFGKFVVSLGHVILRLHVSRYFTDTATGTPEIIIHKYCYRKDFEEKYVN